MFCLFCTTPAENRDRRKTKSKTGISSRARKLVTGSLVFIWLFLILFGLVAATDPAWLAQLAKHGKSGESLQLKDYGDNFLRQGKYHMAISQYLGALEIKPDNVGALVNAAIAYNLAGNSVKGIELLRNTLALEIEQKGTIYYNLAEILEDQGEDSAAIEYYHKAENTEIEPDLVYKKLGSLYMKNKQFEKAQIAFEKVLEIQNDLTTPYLTMLRQSMVLFEDSEKDIQAIKQKLHSTKPLDQLAAYDLEIIAAQSRANPEVAKTHNHLAAIYAMQGDLDRAIEHFEKSLQIWPGNIDAKRNLPLLRQAKNKQQLANAGS